MTSAVNRAKVGNRIVTTTVTRKDVVNLIGTHGAADVADI
jgi:hypothetical protein